jgi:multiple sugar transport system permease protein
MAKQKSIKNSSASLHARRVIANIVLILLTILCLIWFFILLVNTTRSNGELTKGFTWKPSKYFFKNMNNMLHSVQPFGKGLRNTVFVAGLCAVLSTYFSALTAYAIHAYDFKLKKLLYTFILAIMMIPTQVTALGFLNLIDKLKLMDKYIPLIIPSIAAPATFFYMKQYMDSVLPLSIIEASRIDGAGEFRTFNQIILPIMKPAIAVQAIFTFVANWNNYFIPALVLETENKKTLPVLIAELRGADFLKFDMGQVYAAIVFSIFPVVIVYLILSKYIVGGVAAGSVKG